MSEFRVCCGKFQSVGEFVVTSDVGIPRVLPHRDEIGSNLSILALSS